MKKIVPQLFILIFIYGCSQSYKETNIHDLPTRSIQGKRFYTPYCIYFLEETDTIVVNEIKKKVSTLLPKYRLVDSLSNESDKNEYIIEWFSDPKIEYPAPNLDYLQHSGHNLTIQEKNQLQSPHSAVLITFSGTNKDVLNDQININNLISWLLHEKSAIVTDYTTYESFNSKSWSEDRVSNFNKTNQDITSQYTIHVYREKEFCRAVTLGLGKFCLPDISIQDLSCNDQSSYGSLIHLISQTWLEDPVIRIDSTMIIDITTLKNDSVKTRLSSSLLEGATKKAIINLSFVEPQEGDACNSQFEIVFNDKNYSSKQEQQQALIAQVFGVTDRIEYVSHNEKILQASQRAKKKLPDLKNMFNKGLKPGYSILLKAPFGTDNGGREWMWIEVTEWKDSSIKGILQNDPFEIANLSAGSIVSANPDDIFDYVLYLPDGSTEGNETGKIISGEIKSDSLSKNE